MNKLTMLVATLAVGFSTTTLADTIKLDIQPGKMETRIFDE